MNRMRRDIEKSALGPADLSEGIGQQSFRFADDFVGFSGHFPGNPILPAVLQTLLAQLVAEQTAGVPLRLLSLQRAKFTQQLRPGAQIDVRVRCQENQGQLHCASELLLAGETAARFVLVLGKGIEK